MRKLNNGENFDNLVANSTILIAEFGVHTCIPCIAIKNKIERWTHDKDMISTVYIDIDEHRKLSSQHMIFSAPTILVYVNGKLTIRDSGTFSLDMLFDGIERNMTLM